MNGRVTRNRLLFWAFCEALRSGYGLRPIVEAALQCGQTRGRPPEAFPVGERLGLEQNV